LLISEIGLIFATKLHKRALVIVKE